MTMDAMSTTPTVPTVSPEEALRWVSEGAVLLDVREQVEWDAGHAPQALHVPLGSLASAALPVLYAPVDIPTLGSCIDGGLVGGRSFPEVRRPSSRTWTPCRRAPPRSTFATVTSKRSLRT